MTQAVSVFRWDDTAAPQVVDGKPSEYMNVLKKCLVDGFGATTSLQWIIVVDEILTATPFLVLKNDTTLGGSGQFIVFEAVDDVAGTTVKVQCCQAYVDKVNRVNVGAYFGISAQSFTDINKKTNWMIIGTVTGFYMFCTSEGNMSSGSNVLDSYPAIVFFSGDFISNFPNDPGRFVTMSGIKNSLASHANNHLSSMLTEVSSKDLCDIYALDGSAVFQNHSITSLLGNYMNSSGGHNTSKPIINTLCECFLVSDLGRSDVNLNVDEMPFLRAKVPGLYFSAELGYKEETIPFIKEIDGIDYFQLPSAKSNASAVWINLEQW